MALPVVNSPGAHGPVFKGSPKPAKPKAPKVTMPRPAAPKPPTPVREAMQAYRTAIASLNGAVAPVNTAAIAAPYQQAIQTTGQLGVGYGQAQQQSGDQASQQYTQSLNEAQKAAASFGISAGAGADPTLLQNRGTAPIAAQTQASTSAAAAGTNQWQQLLNQAQAATISDATTARQGALDTAQASLATSLPGLIGDAKNRAFQAKTEKFNEGLASSQLDAKQNADLRDYLLGVGKLNATTATAKTSAQIKRDALAEKTTTDQAKLKQGERKLAQGDKALTLKQQAAQKKAQAAGIKGISALNSALKTTTTKGAKPVVGYKVTVVADPNGVNAGAPNQTLTVKDPKSWVPPVGWKVPQGTAPVAVYGQAGAGSSSSLTLSRWNQLFNQFKAANRGLGFSDAQLRASMPARPAK